MKTASIDYQEIEKLNGQWHYPTRMLVGAGRLAELGELCQSLSLSSPLIVTDQGLANMHFVQETLQALKSAGLHAALFHNIKPNPSGSNVLDGVQHYKRGGHDGVIAMGGGSALDAGKAIALMSGQSCSLWELEDIGENWLNANPEGIAPVIAIPTTSGTGSEVGRASVILDEDTQHKKIIFHPQMLPQLVLGDPHLSTGLPAHLTAATGIDAFVHCFEAYCAPAYHPMADGIALEGMRLIKNYLPRAYENGQDLTARTHMMVASSMGASAFQKGLGAVHALAHPLGAIYDAHHGLLNAIILPYVIMRNREAIDAKVSHLARCLGLADPSFEGFYQWVLAFRRQLGIPACLKDIHIQSPDLERIANMAWTDPSAAGNPIALTVEDYRDLLQTAVDGETS